MHISDLMQQAAGDPAAEQLDLHRVARVARQQGHRARRRRQGTVVLGSAAAVAVLLVGSAAVLGEGPLGTGGTGGDSTAGVAGGPTATAPQTARATVPGGEDRASTGPSTGRGVAAGLRDAVQAVADGRAGAFAGQQSDEAYAELEWHDADGQGVSVVGVNVQPGFRFVSSCRGSGYVHCRRTHPSPGATLATYEELTRVPTGVGIRRVAELLRADGTRVLVSATNGYDLPSNGWRITRPEPPLDVAQLTAVVSRSWWGARLPTALLREGRALTPYRDLDAEASTPAPTPSGG